MARSRMLPALLLAGVLTAAAGAAPVCSPDAALSPGCVGDTRSADTHVCFGDGCRAGGAVLGLSAPAPPFTVGALRVEGPSGTRDAGAFPVVLAPGESLVAPVGIVLPSAGTFASAIGWQGQGDGEGASACTTGVSASAPSCGGGDACSGGQTCVGGACVASPPPSCDDGNACTTDLCNPLLGCVHVPSDGSCTSADPCQAPSCDPQRGCVLTPLTGSPCDDHDPCTTGDHCEAGICVAGAGATCDDGIPCTVDTCNALSGCVHQPNDTACPSVDACNIGVCDPVRGCGVLPVTGPACDDGDACTTDDHCVAGRCTGKPITCADSFACTDDVCVAGVCQHVPVNAHCDAGDCSIGSCNPADPAADRRGCVAVPVAEGQACTDDGVPCTDDVCTSGSCLHVPIDSRCGGDSCVPEVCSPSAAGHDANGCIAGPALAGGECAEDGDPCSDDVCTAGHCLHTPVPDVVLCLPVRGAFRKAIGLAALARRLSATVGGAMSSASSRGAAQLAAGMTDRLGDTAADLETVARTLAGKNDGAAPTLRHPPPNGETAAQRRARIASAQLLPTPRLEASFVQTIAAARVRAVLGREAAIDLRRRGRLLLRGTKTLKAELKRLQKVSQTFAR